MTYYIGRRPFSSSRPFGLLRTRDGLECWLGLMYASISFRQRNRRG